MRLQTELLQHETTGGPDREDTARNMAGSDVDG
jgi:hypothetical protein